MFNNTSMVASIANRSERDFLTVPHPLGRRRLPSDPTLPARLPSSAFIEREAWLEAPKEVIRQLRRSPSPSPSSTSESSSHAHSPSSSVDMDSAPHLPESPPPVAPESPRVITRLLSQLKSRPPAAQAGWKEPEPFEILRAIERKDVMFLMEVRDRAFYLLLRKTGNLGPPLLHAMRLGASHQDVAIVLLGAFSRWINHLEDEQLTRPETQKYLKALRTNLKLAIDEGLDRQQNGLIASFMQTLVMSEGETWVSSTAHDVGIALRAGTEGKPVHIASTAVRKFATSKLDKAHAIAALEDYNANATADLLMIGAWTLALASIDGEPIPTYYFARDDRIYRAFVDRLDSHKGEIQRKLTRRLKWQLRVLRTVLEGRATSFHSKVDILTQELDQGPGV